MPAVIGAAILAEVGASAAVAGSAVATTVVGYVAISSAALPITLTAE